MSDNDDRVGAMLNPPHLGELIRESMEEVGWSVTETAGRLSCERGTLSRLLNGSYELAQARRERAVAAQAAGSGVA